MEARKIGKKRVAVLLENGRLKKTISRLTAQVELLKSSQVKRTSETLKETLSRVQVEVPVISRGQKSEKGPEEAETVRILCDKLEATQRELLLLKGSFDRDLWDRAPALFAENVELRRRVELAEADRLRLQTLCDQKDVALMKSADFQAKASGLAKQVDELSSKTGELQAELDKKNQLISALRAEALSGRLESLREEVARLSGLARTASADPGQFSGSLKALGRLLGLEFDLSRDGVISVRAGRVEFEVGPCFGAEETRALETYLDVLCPPDEHPTHPQPADIRTKLLRALSSPTESE